jgi:hypothetical protein
MDVDYTIIGIYHSQHNDLWVKKENIQLYFSFVICLGSLSTSSICNSILFSRVLFIVELKK